MSTPHFYCAELRVGPQSLTEFEARHALQSRRLGAGDKVILFDGEGGRAHATILSPRDADREASSKRARRTALTASVDSIERIARRTAELTLIVAACKGPRLTWMIEKLTELAASRIVIANFERSVVTPRDTRIEKLRRTAIEAAKQSHNYWLPELLAADSLADALAHRRGMLLAADPKALDSLGSKLERIASDAGSATVVIGPEGGLTKSELATLEEAGAVRVRLGETILRVETAAVMVASVWVGWCGGGR